MNCDDIYYFEFDNFKKMTPHLWPVQKGNYYKYHVGGKGSI